MNVFIKERFLADRRAQTAYRDGREHLCKVVFDESHVVEKAICDGYILADRAFSPNELDREEHTRMTEVLEGAIFDACAHGLDEYSA